MIWNHRVIRHADGALEICEVMYDDDGSLMGFSDANVYAAPDEGINSLWEQVQWFQNALEQPILDEADFGVSSPGLPASAPEREKRGSFISKSRGTDAS